MKTKILMVTCCLDQSRADVLNTVVDNVKKEFGYRIEDITVFDNASTIESSTRLLNSEFKNVYQSNKNVGYWSAIDWWLNQLDDDTSYTYIIESDMMHYNVENRFEDCLRFLEANPQVGSVRTHEYVVEQRHLYDKDRPHPLSKRNLWQSHTNKVTGEALSFWEPHHDVWHTTFLTQLPAINRLWAMRESFNELRELGDFSELDFQRSYWKRYSQTGIIDNGLFHCDLNPYGSKVITGSWTDPNKLQSLGYQQTRFSKLLPRDQYTVKRVS